MAGARLTALAALAAVAAGCAGAAPSVSVHEALEQARARGEPAARAAAATTFGYQAPYVPVVVPPDVRRVWVPTHVNEEGELVQGHWVFLRLTDWRWFTAAPRDAGALGVAVPDTPVPPPWPAPGAPPAARLVPWTAGRGPAAEPGSEAPPEAARPAPATAPPAERAPSAPGGAR